MEIFGPGEDWTPDSGQPGGVWCAQRIPDGEVGCSANRSRIGMVNLEDADQFLAFDNIFSLAEVMRDSYAGTEFDVTARADFRVDAGTSPLACPWGPAEPLEPVGVEPERAICLHFSIVASKAFLHTGSFGNTERIETAHFFPPISTAPFSFRVLKNF